MSIDINVYDTASAISQIDCNDWVKLQDVESIIAKVREGERANVTAEFMSNHGDRWEYQAGQRDMLAKCIAAVEAYAGERLAVTKNPNMSEDITSALRVAANRFRALQENP